MKRAILIKWNGNVEPLALSDDVGARLRVLQEAVGGFIEMIPHNVPNMTVFCDEEGKLKENAHLRVNRLANALFGGELKPGDLIVGNVVVMGGIDEEGDEQGLTPEQLDIFLNPDGELINALAGLRDFNIFDPDYGEGDTDTEEDERFRQKVEDD